MPGRLRLKHKNYLARRPDLVFALCLGCALLVGLAARAVGLLPLQ